MYKNSLLYVLTFFCWFQRVLIAFQNGLEKFSKNESKLARNDTENFHQYFCLFEIFKISKSEECNKKIELLKIYVCTILVAIGTTTNLVSFFVFLKANKKSSKILSKNILMLLTISNSMYLLLYW